MTRQAYGLQSGNGMTCVRPVTRAHPVVKDIIVAYTMSVNVAVLELWESLTD